MNGSATYLPRVVGLRSLVFALIAPMLWFSCQEKGVDHNEIATLHELRNLVLTSKLVMVERNAFPPIDIGAYTRWVLQNNQDLLEVGFVRVDDDTESIVDAWGNPLQLIVESGWLVGLGSIGRDAVWQEGKGDDIVLRFEDYDILVGPPGEPVSRAREPEEAAVAPGQAMR